MSQLPQHHQSGAAKRKEKKEREEDAKRSQGAMLKFLNQQPGSSTATSEDIDVDYSEGSSRSLLRTTDQAEVATAGSLKHNTDIVKDFSVSETQVDFSACEVAETAAESHTQNASGVPIGSGETNFATERDHNKNEMLDFTDIGNWPSVLTDSMRLYIVQRGFAAVQSLNSSFTSTSRSRPGENTKGSTRNLTKDWFYRTMPNGEKMIRTWMCFSPSKAALYCFCCKMFNDKGEKDTSSFSSTDGFNIWWKLNPRVADHESSLVHVRNFSIWKELGIRCQRNVLLDDQVQEGIKKEKIKWRETLTRTLDIIRFLAKQNLAFRGHREDELSENKGNFLELVELMSKYDPVLKEHVLKLNSGANKYSYFSKEIQNEFIEMLGNHIRNTIISEVKQAKYYSIMFDSTPDLSHIDQTSQVLRYVVLKPKSVEVRESFIEFIDTKNKNAEDIAQMILDKLKADGLDVMNMRGQGYDNAAVMSGKHTGVQKRISDINPKAKFIACSNHSLNLADMHAAHAEVNSVTFFGTLERLYAFFSASTHRWEVLTSVTVVGLKRIAETRWSARADAVKIVKTHFSKILEVLEQLTGCDENSSTRSDAGLLLVAVQSFSFLGFLGFWATVLTEINDAQIYLQKKGLDIRNSAQKVNALTTYLQTNRKALVDGGISYAEQMCVENGLTDEPQKRVRRKKRMAGENAENARDAGLSFKEELRRAMMASIDRVIREMITRFKQLDELANEYSFLSLAILLNTEAVVNLQHVQEDINTEEFENERKRLKNFAELSKDFVYVQDGGPLELLHFIQRFDLIDSGPNISILLRIFLTMGVSIATSERNFSKLKLIKTYLRSTMSQMRLSSLSILSIEREITDAIDFDEIISVFAARKARKICI